MPRLKPLMGAVLALSLALPAFGQNVTHRPEGKWRTVTTDHFRLHYPLEAEEWALEVASQLDGIRAVVSEEVGYDPPKRIELVVMDPFRDANGFALPFLGRPRMGVFATPPGASSALGNYRTWAEDLVVHEDAHLVHLLRPSRSPFRGFLSRTLGMGPVSTNSPAWVVEGYATVVEGRLTGKGRPNSDYRATMLRSLAQEGRMPHYWELDGGSRWASGRFRYLVGSAFLEWLEAGSYDGALNDLWLRMSARKKREFNDAFEGIFGDDPEVMYGRYVAELTRDAMAIEAARPVEEGTEFADLFQNTSAPAVSADGKRLAAVIASEDGPSRLVVWSTEPDAEADAEWKEAVDALLEKDPEDVPAHRPDVYPPEEVARRVRNDKGAAKPAFMPDGRVLFVSWTQNGQGFARPDLYVWDPDEGGERRITRGADIIEAVAFPDGKRAAAVRTDWGVQTLVEIDLETGDWTPITEPSTKVVDSPRVSPDGTRLAYLVNGEEDWELRIRDLASGEEERVEVPANAIAADPAWLPDGSGLVVSLGHEGFIELAVVGQGKPRMLTATRGGAYAPAVSAEEIFFLTMDSDGMDLRRMPLDLTPVPESAPVPVEAPTADVWTDDAAPAPEPRRPDLSAVGPLALRPEPPPPQPRPAREEVEAEAYGLGRPQVRPLIGLTAGPHNGSVHGMVSSQDIAGKLDVIALGGFTLPKTGGVDGFGLAAAWRGPVRLEVHGYRFRESVDTPRQARQGVALSANEDVRWHGGQARVRLGGVVDAGFGDLAVAPRQFAHLDGRFAHRAWAGTVVFGAEAAGHFALGSTEEQAWNRTEGEVALGFGSKGWTLSGRAVLGAFSGNHPLDLFRLGGLSHSLIPDATQLGQVQVPAFTPFALTGDQRRSVSAELDIQGVIASWERHEIGADSVELLTLRQRMTLEPTALVGVPAVAIDGGVSCTLADLAGRVQRPCTHLDDYAAWASVVWRP